MEEDKKKKKNKKKKGKQANKPSEDVKITGGETTSAEQNHVSTSDKNHCTEVSEDVNVQMAEGLESDVKVDRDQNDGTKGVILEEKVKQLEIEKNSCIQKEVILEEKVKQLESEKKSCIQREVILEEKVKQLEIEKDICIQREAGLHNKITGLENEKDCWLQREANLEDRIKKLESDKEAWVIKEKSTADTISGLNEDNGRVQLEVKLLQQSRDHLAQENLCLMETVSVMQSKIQQLEDRSPGFASLPTATENVHPLPNNEIINAQLEAARALVERLITENAELVEKVNELCIELDRHSVPTRYSPSTESNQVVLMSETAKVSDDKPELSEKLSESLKTIESPAFIQTNGLNTSLVHANGHSTMLAGISTQNSSGSYESGETDEIVQIPLDESDTGEVESQPTEINEQTGVPLTDAPLTGAPFRMISYFARYVSGADLVKSTSNSGR